MKLKLELAHNLYRKLVIWLANPWWFTEFEIIILLGKVSSLVKST